MSYLKQLPLDDVKIGRLFLQNIADNDKDAAIVRAIVQLGRTLDLSVTAEDVESVNQLRMLRDMGCDRAQGFLFGTPEPFAKINEFMQRDYGDIV